MSPHLRSHQRREARLIANRLTNLTAALNNLNGQAEKWALPRRPDLPRIIRALEVWERALRDAAAPPPDD
jgi:hypothetical protein